MRTKKAPSRLGKAKAPKPEMATDGVATEARKNAKKAGDKALMDIASKLPAGAGKEFLSVTQDIDRIEEQMAALNKQKRGCRAKLKEMKIELRPYDHVRKLRKMEPEDMQSFEASVALYKDQLSMKLSAHQELVKKELEVKRERARDMMVDASGGDTGKEVGSAAQENAPEPADDTTAQDPSAAAKMPPFLQRPEKNEEIVPVAATAH